MLTHRNGLNRLHHRNGRNSALFVNAETIRLDLNTVHHSIRTEDGHDGIYYLDLLSSCA